MNQKVLVTGGAGYMGGWLCRYLLQAGYQVVCLDNLSYGDRGIQGIRENPNFTFIQGDICNIRDVALAMNGVTDVIALAAIVGDPACKLNERDTYSVNYESTKILASLCQFYKVRRLIFASSCSVYGASDNLMLNEGSLLNPISLYSDTRVMSEKILLSCPEINPVILRFATLYGYSYRMRYDLVLNIFAAKGAREKRITVHGGDQYRPMVHAQDAARAIILTLQAPDAVVHGQIFNVGSNEQNYTISEMAQITSKAIDSVQVEHSNENLDKRNYRVSFDKIHALLGFRPSRQLAESISEIAGNLLDEKSDYRDPIYYNVQYLYR